MMTLATPKPRRALRAAPAKSKPRRIGRPVTGQAMEERRSIRLSDAIAKEIDELARRSQRTVPAMVRILLSIGLVHQDDVAKYFD